MGISKSMKGADNSKFKAESSKAKALPELEFVLSADSTDREAKAAFLTIQSIQESLISLLEKSNIDSVQLALTDPGEETQRVKNFSLRTDYGLKKKMRVELDLLVLARFEEGLDFWEKGLALSSVIDLLEGFAETQSKEKERFVFLEKGKIPDQKKIDEAVE